MSNLTDLITLLYSYQDDDRDKLAKQLTEQRKGSYINALADLASQYGCNQDVPTPKGKDAKKLTEDSKTDAQSIANTFNRELGNVVQRLYDANPRGNRNYYSHNLNEWAKQRDTWKSFQIGLYTDTTAQQYAQLRFYEMNRDIDPTFYYAPIPPVSDECIARTAAGIVDLAYVQAHETPAHVNCPHWWVALNPRKQDCKELWVG